MELRCRTRSSCCRTMHSLTRCVLSWEHNRRRGWRTRIFERDQFFPKKQNVLVVHRSQDPRVVVIEYDVHGKTVATGSSYDSRFISAVTIEGRKIVRWQPGDPRTRLIALVSGCRCSLARRFARTLAEQPM